MIKVEEIDVWGFKHAIRGMRNPLNSWEKMDSSFSISVVLTSGEDVEINVANPIIGQNDLGLMKRLFKAGTEHRKYLRQIFVSMDITAPLYWWKEWDTYKFIDSDLPHIDANSCSTMHKVTAKEFEVDDFSTEHLTDYSIMTALEPVIDVLNHQRQLYLDTKDKIYWWQIIQLLPTSYNQKRTVTLSYETVMSIKKQRSGHKLDEWREFVKVLDTLPYVKELEEE